MKNPVFIRSLETFSPLGQNKDEIWKNYLRGDHCLKFHDFGGNYAYASFLPDNLREKAEGLRQEKAAYKNLDPTVLYALQSSRAAVSKAGWQDEKNIGINIGSSRGATTLFEKYHQSYVKNGKAEVHTSPATTLGNISSWIAQDLNSIGPEFSHSVTCSTGMHSILNAIAWINSGMTEKFLAGASEAALTPFTIAQMQAMKIYASQERDYPCRTLDLKKSRNTMVLGEGAGVVCLQNEPEGALAKITGIGYATEELRHSVSISADAKCLQDSMKMAIAHLDPGEIDAVVMHAPGTIKGDLAEVAAVKKVFGQNIPALTSNKWKIGHSFGTSGILSIEMAILMMQHNKFIAVPFTDAPGIHPEKLEKVLVNAVGFGGNAVSILLSKA